MAKEAVFEYKCRRCGKVFDWGGIGSDYSAEELIKAMSPDNASSLDSRVAQTNPHANCNGNGTGIGDLIGYRIQEIQG